jgi:hypothetical protein
LQSFWRQLATKTGAAGEVRARPVEAGDKTKLDRVSGGDKTMGMVVVAAFAAKAAGALAAKITPTRRRTRSAANAELLLWSVDLTLRSPPRRPRRACPGRRLGGAKREALIALLLAPFCDQLIEPSPQRSGMISHPRFGDTRGEKAFVSQRAAETPFGDSQRK